MIKSKSLFEFRGRHEVLDSAGNAIGLLEKDFTRSLLRSHWRVRDVSGTELLETHESSWTIAVLRRVAGFLPEWLAPRGMARRSTSCSAARAAKSGRIAGCSESSGIDMLLEVTRDLADVDRRLLVAFAVGLDALQDR